jgi:hypothetical protein
MEGPFAYQIVVIEMIGLQGDVTVMHNDQC